METTRISACRCLRCGDGFEAATDMVTSAKPRGGDATMCATCGCWHVFNDDLTVRAPTREEMRLLARDETVRRLSAVHALFRAQRRRH